MKKIGIVGLGDMGIGMSKNIIQNGFDLTGFDLRAERLEMLSTLGGKPAASCREVGENSNIVFVMVLNGTQAKEVISGKDGLLEGMKEGSTIAVTATIHPSEIQVIEGPVLAKGINLIDSPVSGGKSGADNGTLTLMTVAKKNIFEECKPVLEAISKDIHYVGDKIGMGQTTKAALQALIGSSFTAIFESLVLGVKAGVPAETLYKVFGTSGVSSNLFKGCARLILDRKFEKTGSHIGTMYKDLGISMNLAKEKGCMMSTTAAAYELFRAGFSLFPDGDNWSIVKLLEQIAGTEVKGNSGDN
jgi:3-hydroxyisobutyrate dehydrogenase-like beta-hydroxyacid dehydrogenase